MRKSEITWHVLGYGSQMTPAVNVKWGGPRGPIPAEFPGLTWAYIDSLSASSVNAACEDAQAVGWERAEEAAREIWGPSAKVYSVGRSGGWAYVAPYGRSGFTRDDVAGWDAVALARWARFARECRALADDTEYQFLWYIYHGHFEPAQEAAAARREEAMVAAIMRCAT